MRSYEDFTLGFALLLFAAAIVRTAWVRRPTAYLNGLSGVTHLLQGWIVGSAITSGKSLKGTLVKAFEGGTPN